MWKLLILCLAVVICFSAATELKNNFQNAVSSGLKKGAFFSERVEIHTEKGKTGKGAKNG